MAGDPMAGDPVAGDTKPSDWQSPIGRGSRRRGMLTRLQNLLDQTHEEVMAHGKVRQKAWYANKNAKPARSDS